MRIDPNFLGTLTTSLDQSSTTEAKLSAELSSGLAVSLPSDNPIAAAQSSLLSGAISANDTYVQTATSLSSRMQAADSTLGEAVTQITTAIGLAVQAANGTLNSSELSTVQQQISGIRDSVLSLANTSYAGSYLFGGSQGTTQPFTLDTSTTPATVTYNGDTASQTVVTPTGQSIQTSVPGSSLFGAVFTALNQLVADLSSSNPTTAAAADQPALTTALSQLSGQRAVLDSSLSRLQSSSTYAQTQESSQKVEQGSLVSADTATVATSLSSVETQHQALLSVVSALEQQSNLFDYMH